MVFLLCSIYSGSWLNESIRFYYLLCKLNIISDGNLAKFGGSVVIFAIPWSCSNLTAIGITTKVKEHWHLNGGLRISSGVCHLYYFVEAGLHSFCPIDLATLIEFSLIKYHIVLLWINYCHSTYTDFFFFVDCLCFILLDSIIPTLVCVYPNACA